MAGSGSGHGVDRRAFLGAALLTAAGGPAALAQPQPKIERPVEPQSLPLDRANVWTLSFRYKAPRIITVDALVRDPATGGVRPGRKTCWYMWFQVYHRFAEPVTCLPEFELVSQDPQRKVPPILDEPEPYVLDQIRKIEDPEGILNIQSTISISKKPIPPSKPDAFPRYVTGAAVWLDMPEKAPGLNRFSVFVTGLSNGLATQLNEAGNPIVTRKTLQVDFFRPTDDRNPNATDVRPFEETGPAEKWIYRETPDRLRPAAPPEPKRD